MVQNYHYLNEQTIKNNYPLSLIIGRQFCTRNSIEFSYVTLIQDFSFTENIGTKKVFTKMDLQWEYNNI